MRQRVRNIIAGSIFTLICFFAFNSQAQVCPAMTGALIDACAVNPPPPVTEGTNEVLAFRTGTLAAPVTQLINVISYFSTTVPMPPVIPSTGQNFSDSYVANTVYVDSLNMIANCDQALFIDAFTAGSIPAETHFWIMQGVNMGMTHPGPDFPYDFSFLCNNGPVYLLFSADNSWSNNGNFKNNTGSGTNLDRYFLADFTAVDASCTQVVYDYLPNQLPDDDMGDENGGSIHFPPAGGTADNYFNDGCTPRTLFDPPPTQGDDAICQTDGSTPQAMEFETTFCGDGDACTQDLCTVDLQAPPFTEGLCSNPPITTCEPDGDGCCPAGCEGPVEGGTCFNPDGSPIPGCDEDCSAMGPIPVCGDDTAQFDNGEECDGLDAANCPSGICNSDCSCQALNNAFLQGSGSVTSCKLSRTANTPRSTGSFLILLLFVFGLSACRRFKT